VTAVRATRVTDAMMTAAAAAVGDAATIRRDPHGTLLPDRAQLVGTRPARPSTAPGATRYQS
jgi:malic enzyme